MSSFGFTRLGALLFAGAALAATGCGNDHQTRLSQIDLPVDGTHLFLPLPVDVCQTSTDCEDGDRCTEDRCLSSECVRFTVPSEECCPADAIASNTFDDELDGSITLHNLTTDVGWSRVDGRGTGETAALYFGDPARDSYDTGGRVAGFVEMAPVTLPRDRENILSMRLFTQIETGLDYDLFYITAEDVTPGNAAPRASGDSLFAPPPADSVTHIYSKSDLPVTAFEGFALVDIALDEFAGKTVILRVHFDTLDGRDNQHVGIFLDDLRVESLCFRDLPCTTDADCVDETPDSCLVGACTDAGCAMADKCEPPPELSPCDAVDAPEGCCIADADCDDGDASTLDICDGATCEHTMNPDACVTDADCGDEDSCTSERCVAGVCAFRGDSGATCCVKADAAIADFDRDTLQGIYVTDNFETGVFWRTDATRSSKGDYALYCGEPVSQSYAFDRRVKSSATTRPLAIPAGGETTLVFDLYKNTRTTRHFDVFQVAILRDEGLFPLWTSKDLSDGTTQGAWNKIRVPLTDYAGQNIQVRFVFDSADAPPAGFEGTYLDSLRLETRCK